jgi:NAD(P) transhydrogenase
MSETVKAPITSAIANAVETFDLVVIGSGPGGKGAALQAAKSGKSVAVIEQYHRLGGGCVHWGTLPSKSLRESAYRWSLGSKAGTGLPDMERLMRRKERVIDKESEHVFHQLSKNHIQIYQGEGRFSGGHGVEVVHEDGTISQLTAKRVVIAVGAQPVAPSYCKVDGVRVFDSSAILQLKHTPKSMVVLGAGIIGCEYASIFQAIGTKVTLVDKRSEILSTVDREIVFHLVDRFVHLGMELELETEATRFEEVAEGLKITLSNGKTIETETCIVAMGRQGNTAGLQLDRVGLVADARGQLKVGEHFETSVSWIYAVGDVVGFPALASTSMEQGRIAACIAFHLDDLLSRFELYPYGIYTIPEISTIGMSEDELTAKGIPFVVGRAGYREVARGQIVGDEWGMLKMLVDPENFKILGVHIVGDNAADLIHIGQAVMRLDGDLRYFLSTVFNYPTLAEAYKTAAFNAYNKIIGRRPQDQDSKPTKK